MSLHLRPLLPWILRSPIYPSWLSTRLEPWSRIAGVTVGGLLIWGISSDRAIARSDSPPPAPLLAQVNSPNRPGTSPSLEPPPEVEPLPTLPDPAELLGPDVTPAPPPELPLPGDEITFVVERFELVDSTVYTNEDFAELFATYTDRPITFEEVLAVRDAITAQYRADGYLTSGAIIPPQPLQDGVVEIQMVEGGVEAIIIEGTNRLQPAYISSRLGLGAQTPLQIDDLLDQLQLLQLNPLIDTISADLQAGTTPGTNLLVVNVTEADSFAVNYAFDNNRSPSVGSLRHRLGATEGNLTGLGDPLAVSASLTEGSQGLDLSYALPVSPRNTLVSVYYSTTDSDVIEAPFDILEAASEASVLELAVQHPLVQTPTTELVVGLIGSHQRTQTFLGIDDIGGFPLSAGADDEGRTRVTALRLFQAWTQRSTQQVFAVRSQFNFGLSAFDATVNEGDTPDSQFVSWLGQGQWVRLMHPDTPLIVKGSVQLTPNPLLTLERYGLGGQATVRGYRQDALLTDNGAALSVEARFPIWADPEQNALLQITPFIDSGYGWNTVEADPEDNALLSAGAGLLLQVEDATFRLDWGIPLFTRDGDENTLQEQGIYFILDFSFL